MQLQGAYLWLVLGALIVMTILVIVFVVLWWRWHNNCTGYTGESGYNYKCNN